MKKPSKEKCYYPDCLTSYCEHHGDCKYDDLSTNDNGRKLLKGIGYALLIMVALIVMVCSILNHLFHDCTL